jgi:pimeloyl-ACP methyl ester carboxylesterase
MYLIKEPAASGGDAVGTLPGPPVGLFLTEPARGLVELATLPLAAPWLAAAPRGYEVRGWSLGRNVGPTDAVLDELPRALAALAERAGGPVSVVGWSLGGIYARELARQHPEHVRQVITLGSPFALTDPRQSRADRVYQSRSYLHAAPGRVPTPEQVAMPIAVPSTAVYSRLDGIVSWQACQEPETRLHENVEVRCSHLGFGVDPATLWLVADRLAASGRQRPPFRPPVLLRRLYPGHW